MAMYKTLIVLLGSVGSISCHGVATSSQSMVSGEGWRYSYGIAHGPPGIGHAVGESFPHGYGGFGTYAPAFGYHLPPPPSLPPAPPLLVKLPSPSYVVPLPPPVKPVVFPKPVPLVRPVPYVYAPYQPHRYVYLDEDDDDHHHDHNLVDHGKLSNYADLFDYHHHHH